MDAGINVLGCAKPTASTLTGACLTSKLKKGAGSPSPVAARHPKRTPQRLSRPTMPPPNGATQSWHIPTGARNQQPTPSATAADSLRGGRRAGPDHDGQRPPPPHQRQQSTPWSPS